MRWARTIHLRLVYETLLFEASFHPTNTGYLAQPPRFPDEPSLFDICGVNRVYRRPAFARSGTQNPPEPLNPLTGAASRASDDRDSRLGDVRAFVQRPARNEG